MAIFDEISGSYDSWYNTKLGAFADKVEAELVMGKSRLLSGMQVLDAGCGTGNFSIKLAKLGCRVTGIDVSSGMLEEALKKPGNDIENGTLTAAAQAKKRNKFVLSQA